MSLEVLILIFDGSISKSFCKIFDISIEDGFLYPLDIFLNPLRYACFDIPSIV